MRRCGRRARVTIATTVVTCLCGLTEIALAEAPESGKSGTEEVIVTAQRRDENLVDVPISIKVLSGSDLDKSSFSGVTESLRAVPGFDTNEDQFSGGMTLTMRGVSNSTPRNAGAGPVAYYVDSVPFGFARSAIYPDPAAYDLQQIEVLSGPQGTLYGANALSGVLRILTKDASADELEFKARTSVSSTQRGGENYRGDVVANVPIIEGKLGARATVGYQDDSGWVDAPNVKDVNDSERRSYRLKLRGQPMDTLTVDLLAWRMETDDGAPPLSRDDGRITSVVDQPQTSDFDVFGLKLSQEFSAFSITSMTSYMEYEASGVVDATPTGTAATLNNFPQAQVFSQEINLVSDLDGVWRWSAGVFYRDTKEHLDRILRSTATGAIIAVQDNFTDFSESMAVYGELGRRLTDEWDLAVGLRYFRDEQETQLDKVYTSSVTGITFPVGSSFSSTSDAVTPRVVLTWKPGPDRMVYASYSQGFRSGFAQLPNVQVLYPNFTPLKPDKLTNYEVGSKGLVLDGRFSYETAVFFIDWKDIQQGLSVLLGNGTTTVAMVNGAAANGIGASFAFSTRPFDALELGGSVGWNDLHLDGDVISGGAVLLRSGRRLQYSPEYTAGVFGEYSWNVGDFAVRLNLSGDYKSAQTDEAVPLPSGVEPSDDMFFASARISFETADRWTIALYGENLTDEYGATLRLLGPPSARNFEFSPRPRPRTIGLQLDYHFGG